MMSIHHSCSRVSVRRATRAMQTCQRCASHSEAATAIAGAKERTR
jgi:hypothetical protein